MKIIFLGAPGAGKGTQAEKVCERYNIPAISTGAIIREAIKTCTEMGMAAKAYTEKGALVPDEVVIGIITSFVLAFVAGGIQTVYQIEKLPLVWAILIHVISMW